VIAASVRYGRSGNKMDVHHQTDKVHHAKYRSGVPTPAANYFTQEKFADTHVYHAESHSIMDFQAGKDIGLGLFGEDLSAVLSAGVRIAQFNVHSSVDMRARPDLHWKYLPSAGAPTKGVNVSAFHTYHATENAARKFQGVGPTLSWTGSAPVWGDQGSGIDFDWGANGALLFGRQKTNVHHQGYGRYWPRNGEALYNEAYLVYANQDADGHHSNKSVIVPNIGAFAGVSWRYQNAKVSFGYRTDEFFGAMDGGIDTHRSENVGFFGPFANISIGLGG
jgi:iron complex outermembrane receptor protein